VHFRTWEALASEGMSSDKAAELMTKLVLCAARR
jgi:hypothetical protein